LSATGSSSSSAAPSLTNSQYNQHQHQHPHQHPHPQQRGHNGSVGGGGERARSVGGLSSSQPLNQHRSNAPSTVDGDATPVRSSNEQGWDLTGNAVGGVRSSRFAAESWGFCSRNGFGMWHIGNILTMNSATTLMTSHNTEGCWDRHRHA
jgi:hypothetical protein